MKPMKQIKKKYYNQHVRNVHIFDQTYASSLIVKNEKWCSYLIKTEFLELILQEQNDLMINKYIGKK